jgi:hypothetical protein
MLNGACPRDDWKRDRNRAARRRRLWSNASDHELMFRVKPQAREGVLGTQMRVGA